MRSLISDDGRNPSRRAVRACAAWLVSCVRLGWRRTDLDALERLWWQYHDDDGRLTCAR